MQSGKCIKYRRPIGAFWIIPPSGFQYNESHITQGNLGDCWFLAALAAVVAVQPGHIENSIEELSVDHTQRGHGLEYRYKVTTFRDGYVQYNYIDEMLPFVYDKRIEDIPERENNVAKYTRSIAEYEDSEEAVATCCLWRS